MRRMVAFGLIAAGHFVLTVFLVMFTFGAGLARFDTRDGSHWTETVASSVVKVLAFPLLLMLDHQSCMRFPRLWGYVPFAANSLIWAGAIVALRRMRRRVPGRRSR